MVMSVGRAGAGAGEKSRACKRKLERDGAVRPLHGEGNHAPYHACGRVEEKERSKPCAGSREKKRKKGQQFSAIMGVRHAG